MDFIIRRAFLSIIRHVSLDTSLWLTTTYEYHIPLIIQTVISRDTQCIVSVTYQTTQQNSGYYFCHSFIYKRQQG